jgi:hypothetical protein
MKRNCSKREQEEVKLKRGIRRENCSKMWTLNSSICGTRKPKVSLKTLEATFLGTKHYLCWIT